MELALTQARYEAELARRQYERSIRTTVSSPPNWSAAGTTAGGGLPPGGAAERLRTRDQAVRRRRRNAPGYWPWAPIWKRCWHHPSATAETRKRIIRTVIAEIVVKLVEDTHPACDPLARGRSYPALTVPRNRTGKHRWSTEAETGDLIRALARQQPDSGIAAILNRAGKRTGKRQHLDRSAGAQLS